MALKVCLHSLKQININLAMFYYAGFCMYHGSSENIWFVEFADIIPSTLNLSDSVNKAKIR